MSIFTKSELEELSIDRLLFLAKYLNLPTKPNPTRRKLIEMVWDKLSLMMEKQDIEMAKGVQVSARIQNIIKDNPQLYGRKE